MGGKIWSADEERAFWTIIVPEASAGRDAPSQGTFAPLVDRMKQIGDSSRRNYTAQGLYEHWHLNAVQKTFSPNGRAYAQRYIRDKAMEQLESTNSVANKETGLSTASPAVAPPVVTPPSLAPPAASPPGVAPPAAARRYMGIRRNDQEASFLSARVLLEPGFFEAMLPQTTQQPVRNRKEKKTKAEEGDLLLFSPRFLASPYRRSAMEMVPVQGRPYVLDSIETDDTSKTQLNGNNMNKMGKKNVAYTDTALGFRKRAASPSPESAKSNDERLKRTSGEGLNVMNQATNSLHKEHSSALIRSHTLPPVRELVNTARSQGMQSHDDLDSEISEVEREISSNNAEIRKLKINNDYLLRQRRDYLATKPGRQVSQSQYQHPPPFNGTQAGPFQSRYQSQPPPNMSGQQYTPGGQHGTDPRASQNGSAYQHYRSDGNPGGKYRHDYHRQ